MMDKAPNTPPAEGLWLSISELAIEKSLGKAAVSERVSRLEAQGLLRTRPGKGRVKLVNVAEYEEAVGQTTDLVRDLGHATRRDTLAPNSSPGDPVYTVEQARRMAYQADREKIALGRDLELLVPVDQFAADAVRIFSAMIRPLDRLEARADALSLAVSQGGTAGARTFLKGIKIEIRNLIADSLRELHEAVAREPPRALDDFSPIIRNKDERAG
ncbi:hypothetical protein [Methylobacterium sp. E-045]|uniref:hypothetical protein n=1 Tax=Methylobacterium sp. E-045 TaxID=2836575 RepID=UPI001FBB9A4B|nr:hypothetical protein [Methylobacterium sp. E-045]MCJ2132156.1 hypothetical protein [Methylobacterium sp. E-045]